MAIRCSPLLQVRGDSTMKLPAFPWLIPGHRTQTAFCLLSLSLAFSLSIYARTGSKAAPQKQSNDAFYVYQDSRSDKNHFTPSGYMGDIGDIKMEEAFKANPHSGRTCIRVSYSAKGKGPNTCSHKGTCRWAGVYWQEPPNNWGDDLNMKDGGFNLSGYTRLVFWARADNQATVQFQVGGIDKLYGDSLKSPQSITAQLTTTWQEFSIDLAGKDMSHVIGGFAWKATADANTNGAIFYLDDVRFEKK
jgi:hypothetical protein